MKKSLIIIFFVVKLIYSQTNIEWLTSNPFNLTLNNFYAIDNSTFYAVGNSGLIIKSEDGGKSWKTDYNLTSSISELRKIYFFNNKDGVVCGDVKPMENSKIYYTTDGGMNWLEAQFPYSVHLNDWIFIDSVKGIAVAYDEIYKTNDRGKSWTKESLPFGYKYNSIKRNYDNSLVISGGRVEVPPDKYTAGITKGVIILSKDNGATWMMVKEFDNLIPLNTYFFSQQIGIASFQGLQDRAGCGGTHKKIGRTTDSGQTWTILRDECNYFTLTDMVFISNQVGFITFSSGFYYTNDQGLTWSTEYYDGTSVNQLFQKDNLTYSVGGSIRYTSDNGKTWFYITHNFLGRNGSLEMLNDKTLLQVGGSSVWISTDSAKTWTNKWIYPYIYNLVGSSFLDLNFGYVINITGEIFKTENGGDTWIQQTYNNSIYLTKIKMYDKNIGVIVGSRKDLPDSENGAVLFTSDGGENWNMSSIQSGLLYSVDYADRKTWFCTGPEGTIYKSSDGGKTWTLNFKLNKSYLSRICFSTKNIGYAGGSNGILLKTTNQGGNWELLDFNLTNDDYINDIKFYGELFGVITVSNGESFTTVDGGKTWLKEYLHSQIGSLSIYKNTCYGSGFNTLIRFHKEGNFFDDKKLSGDSWPDTTNLSASLLIKQNFPNPFNSLTTIEYSIPNDTFVKLHIYNSLGQLVETPIAGYKLKGRYTFNYTPSKLSTGVYFYEIATGNEHSIKKMIYLK